MPRSCPSVLLEVRDRRISLLAGLGVRSDFKRSIRAANLWRHPAILLCLLVPTGDGLRGTGKAFLKAMAAEETSRQRKHGVAEMVIIEGAHALGGGVGSP
jgi:hypothetical protein